MRAVLIASVLVFVWTARLLPQDGDIKAPAKPPPGPPKVSTSEATVSGRQPAVFWTRDMSKQSPARADASLPSPRQAVFPPPPVLPKFTREQMLQALANVQAGMPRAQVIDRLGAPAYSIAMEDEGHYRERCRFRSGTESIATIEFRDGLAATIEKTPR